LQQNPHEGFSNTPRVSFEKIIRAGFIAAACRSNGHTDMPS
jgi:hypothetical protein